MNAYGLLLILLLVFVGVFSLTQGATIAGGGDAAETLQRLRCLRAQSGGALLEKVRTTSAWELVNGDDSKMVMGDWTHSELKTRGANPLADLGRACAGYGKNATHLRSMVSLAMLVNVRLFLTRIADAVLASRALRIASDGAIKDTILQISRSYVITETAIGTKMTRKRV